MSRDRPCPEERPVHLSLILHPPGKEIKVTIVHPKPCPILSAPQQKLVPKVTRKPSSARRPKWHRRPRRLSRGRLARALAINPGRRRPTSAAHSLPPASASFTLISHALHRRTFRTCGRHHGAPP